MFDDQRSDSGRELDRIIASARNDLMDDHTIANAAERVWREVEGAAREERSRGAIQTCADYQALIPDLLAGRLSEAQAMLVSDHATTCFACRKVLERARRGDVDPESTVAVVGYRERAHIWQRVPARAIAALVVVALGLAGIFAADQLFIGNPVVAHADGVDDDLYRVTDSGNVPLAAGDEIRAGDTIRAGRQGGAMVAMVDGSQIEMDSRSELSMLRSGGSGDLRLARGNIIVRAAPQEAGELRVLTEDCAVRVTGTVFVVRHGAKGSRVSVLEGEVVVTQDDGDTVLEPGEQITTDPRLQEVDIYQDIEWSRDVDDYVALVTEFRRLREEMSAIPVPERRFESRLLRAVPDDTVIYVGLPNVSSSIAEAYSILDARMAESDVLRNWWASESPLGGRRARRRRVGGPDRGLRRIPW